MTEPLLEVQDLTKTYSLSGGAFGHHRGQVRAVDGISFAVEAGTTFALVGESGCGKTTTAKVILGLEAPSSGTIRFRGQDLAGASKAVRRDYRRSVQAVLQDPYSSLSPRMKVRDIVGEPLRIHTRLSGRELAVRVSELLDQVGLPQAAAGKFPHQFSGGQRQRIAIARALSLDPALIVLDEPVSALDVSIRAQIVNLLTDLQQRLGLSYLLISHDMATVEHMSHRVGMMYVGQLVEVMDAKDMHETGRHPYTQAMMAAVPSPVPGVPMGRTVGGEIPNPADPPSGCRFHPRCPLRADLGEPAVCADATPELLELEAGHRCACHFSDRTGPVVLELGRPRRSA
jgi:oligopeptide/dipeptide ABC transporter ATP-binding protein